MGRVPDGDDVVGVRGGGCVAVGADGVALEDLLAPAFVIGVIAALVAGTAGLFALPGVPGAGATCDELGAAGV